MGVVTETASGVPIATFSMGTFFLSVISTDKLSVSGLSPAKTYTLTVVVSSAYAPSHSVTTTLVTPPMSNLDSCSNGVIGSDNGPVPDFDMALNQTVTPEFYQGIPSVSYVLTYTSINGFAGFVHESVTGLPVQYIGFASSARDPSYGYCRVEFSCRDVATIFTGGLAPGTYTVTITAAATGGAPYHTLTVTFTVP